MRRRRSIGVLLFGVSLASIATAPCLAAEKIRWQDLFDLAVVQVEGVALHYEKALEPGIAEAKSAFRAHLAREAERRRKLADPAAYDLLIETVNGIVGLEGDARPLAAQRKLLRIPEALWPLSGGSPTRRVNVYLLRQGVIKDYLRGGGELPDFAYDRATDRVNYSLSRFFPIGRAPERKDLSIVLPVAGAASLGREVAVLLGMIYGEVMVGAAVHEIVELAILVRLKPVDPYFRWFSDGFANAIAMRVLAGHVDEEAAAGFADAYDTAPYKDLEKQVNLFYWMGKAFEVETPLDSENRLTMARYAFATYEARRLIEAHGIECVKAILDKAVTGEVNLSRQLVGATAEVTGEDIRERFKRYQSFAGREEGLPIYSKRFNSCYKRADYAAALSSLLRVMELREEYDADSYSNAAELLVRMGREEYADRVLASQVKRLRGTRHVALYRGVTIKLIEYALKHDRFETAYEAAREVLAANPDWVPALFVRLHELVKSKQLDDARETAGKILEKDTDTDSPFHRHAKALLEKLRKPAAPQ